MQNVTLKFLISIFLTLTFHTSLKAVSTENELVKADSLYSIKLYTESLKLYESILEEGKATPAMLLKMARIEEGLKNYGLSIYYLEKYFELTADKKVLEHIQQIAEKEKLNGYTYDFPFYLSFHYDKWQHTLSLLLAALLTVVIALMIKNRKEVSKNRQFLVFSVLLILLIGLSNNVSLPKYAIILNTPTFLLEGPSAASNTVEKINKNHKVRIKGAVDVWTETQWNENKAYIKTDHLKKL